MYEGKTAVSNAMELEQTIDLRCLKTVVPARYPIVSLATVESHEKPAFGSRWRYKVKPVHPNAGCAMHQIFCLRTHHDHWHCRAASRREQRFHGLQKAAFSHRQYPPKRRRGVALFDRESTPHPLVGMTKKVERSLSTQIQTDLIPEVSDNSSKHQRQEKAAFQPATTCALLPRQNRLPSQSAPGRENRTLYDRTCDSATPVINASKENDKAMACGNGKYSTRVSS